MFELLKDVWDYIRIRKKYFLAPIIILLLVLGSLIVVVQGTSIAPLIYTIF